MTAETPRGFVPFAPSVPIKQEPAGLAGAPAAAYNIPMPDETSINTISNSTLLSKNVIQDAIDKKYIKIEKSEQQEVPADKKPTKYYCTTCTVECTIKRFHCTKVARVELCPSCFQDGRFPANLYSGDFVRMDEEGAKPKANKWSEQELLLLLEGLEMYDEDWVKVSEHVGSRSKDECIAQFLRLPIEDPFVDSHGGAGAASIFDNSRFPMSAAENPAIALASFLTTVVKPSVAKAAAEAAIAEVEQNAPGKKNDAMDIDDSNSLEKTAATALGTAAAKSYILATYEEREATRLLNQVIELQLQKIQLKISHFEQLEQLVENERIEIEKERQNLYLERLAFRKIASQPAENGAVRNGSSYSNIGSTPILANGEAMEDGDVTMPAANEEGRVMMPV